MHSNSVLYLELSVISFHRTGADRFSILLVHVLFSPSSLSPIFFSILLLKVNPEGSVVYNLTLRSDAVRFSGLLVQIELDGNRFDNFFSASGQIEIANRNVGKYLSEISGTAITLPPV